MNHSSEKARPITGVWETGRDRRGVLEAGT